MNSFPFERIGNRTFQIIITGIHFLEPDGAVAHWPSRNYGSSHAHCIYYTDFAASIWKMHAGPLLYPRNELSLLRNVWHTSFVITINQWICLTKNLNFQTQFSTVSSRLPFLNAFMGLSNVNYRLQPKHALIWKWACRNRMKELSKWRVFTLRSLLRNFARIHAVLEWWRPR